MKQRVFTKDQFKKMNRARLYKWIDVNRIFLAGSCIASNSNKGFAPIITKLSRKKSVLQGFIPSHIGSIVMENGILYVFNMMPPKASKIELSEYIMTSDDDFMLVLRDFELDIQKFSQDVLKYDDHLYPYWSAVQSISKFIDWMPNIGKHCSELHAKMLQNQGYFTGVHCDNLTPVEVFELLAMGNCSID